MADRKYAIGRPTQEVRLRNWKGGQVAQFKKAIEILETELNTVMASQVNQGAKRVVVTSLPKISGVTVTSGFKSFQIKFTHANTIKNLLFYEIQKDSTSSFASPTTYTTPQTTLTIPTASERETIFVRIRLVTSKFQAGPWSTAVTATGSSNFRISTTRGARTTLEIAPASFNTWVDVQSISFPTTTSSLSVSAQPGVHARMTIDGAATPPVRNSSSAYDVSFRILKDGVELTDAGICRIRTSSSYVNNAGEGENQESKTEAAGFGVLISPFETFTNSETVVYIIQANVYAPGYGLGGSESEDTILGNSANPIDNPIIVIDSFDILEIVQVT